MNQTTCSCNHIMNSIGRPPDFLQLVPKPLPLPVIFNSLIDFEHLNILIENSKLKFNHENQLQCINFNHTVITTPFSSLNNEQESSYILLTIIVFIALIIALVIFILFAFVYVYLNRLKLTKNRNGSISDKTDVSVNVLPFHQFSQQRSESSPSSTQSNLTSIIFNESDSNSTSKAVQFNYNVKNGQILKLIDSAAMSSASYCSQSGLLKKNDVFNLNSSASSSSSSGVLMSSSSFNNTKQFNNNNSISDQNNILMYPAQQKQQQMKFTYPIKQSDNHQYESITDLSSQYYFDINDEPSANAQLFLSPLTFQSTFKANNHLLTISNNNLIQQQYQQRFQINNQQHRQNHSFLNSLIV